MDRKAFFDVTLAFRLQPHPKSPWKHRTQVRDSRNNAFSERP